MARRFVFTAVGLGASKFRFDFFGVGQPIGDFFAAIGEHLKNAAIGEFIKQEANDPEADDLGNQAGPIHAECSSDLLGSATPTAGCFSQ